MQTLSDIRALLADRGLRPRHALGQNFLHDHNLIRKLAQAADLQPGDLVLEVGPGTGALTEALLEAGAVVIVCEIDDRLADIVEERLGDRVTLIRGDCLSRGRELNPKIVGAIHGRPFKLVANLPYGAASALISAILIRHPENVGLYVTIQKEVADRLAARPGTKAYGPLSIIVQSLAVVQRIATVPASCFWPQPKVISAMVAITPDLTSAPGVRKVRIAHADARVFARFITDLFTKRRKQLGTILGRDHADWPEGVEPDMRPEALTVEQLVGLWSAHL